MYLEHYQIRAKPFDLSPGPDFLWLGEKHNEALATLRYGILANLGFLLLTGDVGVGKTALIHRLIHSLDESTIVAHITDPGLGTLDFFRLLAADFNIGNNFQSKGEFLIKLEEFLYRSHAENKRILLIVDEAQRLNNKLLDQIRVLSNIELSDQKLINIFFIGQPEFKTMLLTDKNRAIRQRIAINYQIEPLSESETGTYIEHRMKVAGASRAIFKPNAIKEIYKFTRGYPRAINIICDHALLTGYSSDLQTIDSRVIRECENELDIQSDRGTGGIDIRKPKTSLHPTRPVIRSDRKSESGAGGSSAHRFDRQDDLAFSKTGLQGPSDGFRMSAHDFQKPSDRFRMSTETRLPEKPSHRATRPGSWGYAMLISLFIGACALGSYYVLWPEVRLTMKPPPPTPLAESLKKSANDIQANQTGRIETTETIHPQSSKVDQAIPVPPAKKKRVHTQTPHRHDRSAVDDRPELFTARAQPAPAKILLNFEAEGKKAASSKTTDDRIARTTKSAKQDVPPVAAVSPPPQVTAPAPVRHESAEEAHQTPTSKALPQPATGQTSVKSPPTDEAGKALEAKKNLTVAVTRPESKIAPKVATHAPAVGSTKVTAVPTPKIKPKPSSSLPKSAPVVAPTRRQRQTPPRHSSLPATASTRPVPRPSAAQNAKPLLQAAVTSTGNTAPTTEKPAVNALKERLQSFLQTYCGTYADKNLNAFTRLFTPDALENGKPFQSLLPKYKRNFDLIKTIQYRIDLQGFSYDEDQDIVKISGIFFLKWLPPDLEWRENSGSIFMRLKKNGSSFLVQRLDYYGAHSPKK